MFKNLLNNNASISEKTMRASSDSVDSKLLNQ